MNIDNQMDIELEIWVVVLPPTVASKYPNKLKRWRMKRLVFFNFNRA
jgi:hypothetical protein